MFNQPIDRLMTGARITTVFALAACAAPAWAQSGSFDRPLGARVAHRSGGESSEVRMMMQKAEGGDTYEVTIRNGEVSAVVNGKAVPADRVRRTGDTVEILGADGKTVATFDVPPEPPTGMGNAWRLEPEQFMWESQQGPAPKVMLGVTMAEPGESLVEHYDLEPGSVVLVDRVVEGLSADKAGLRKGDLITSFDGKKPITAAQIREVLGQKKPGDAVKAVILRKGEERAVTITLQEYDRAQLGTPSARARIHWLPNAEALAMTERHREGAERAMQEMLGAYREARGARGLVFGPGGKDVEVFATPIAPELRTRMAELDKKLDALDEKMARLDESLTRLERRLESLGR